MYGEDSGERKLKRGYDSIDSLGDTLRALLRFRGAWVQFHASPAGVSPVSHPGLLGGWGTFSQFLPIAA